MKLFITYSLLLSFFVLLSPRNLWHECEDNHTFHSNSEVHLENEDCFACEYDLGVILQAPDFFISFAKPIFNKFEITLENQHLPSKFEHFSHRGPPII